MILTEKRISRYLLLMAGALLTGLTVTFPILGLLEWISLIPVGLFLLEMASDQDVRLRRLYAWSFFFFFCYGLVTFHWFVNLYPLDFIDGMTEGGALAVVGASWIGLSLFQALFGGFVFLLTGVLFRSHAAIRIPFLKPFMGAGVWAVYEWTQTLGWWGVPWGRLPLGQVKLLVGLQSAEWFGTYWITFLLVSVNFCLAYAILSVLRRREAPCRGAVRSSCIAVAAILIFQYATGVALWFSKPVGQSEKTGTVAGVQGNIASNEKWSGESLAKTKAVYREYTLAAAEQGADVVVWPETALPYTVKEGNSTYQYVSDLAREAEVTILAGAFTKDYDEEGNPLSYNSLICFLPDGAMHETVYSKRHLVPFGEFVPMRGLFETLIPPLAELVMSGDDLAKGENAAVITLDEGQIGSLICFDSIYEALTLDSVRDGAQLICLSTNDSWFTDSVALDMHNAQAQLRAIESGRYVLRAANTGISSLISHRGEEMERIPSHDAGMVIGEAELRESRTLYSYIGNTFVYLLILVFVNLIAYDVGVKIRKILKKRGVFIDRDMNL